MSLGTYILDDENTPEPTDDAEFWSRWMFECIDRRRVAFNELSGVSVSTVFLGLDHNCWGGPPLLFETLVFGGEHDGRMWRYSTWKEAAEGHLRAAIMLFGT